MDKHKLVTELLDIVTKHLKIKGKYGGDYQSDRDFLRAICNASLSLDGIDERFYALQDQLLSVEREEKGVVDVEEFDFHDQIALWQGDITRLKADAIVNAANDQFLGCFIPGHDCIDNVIMSSAGFQMRNELLGIMSTRIGRAERVKVTFGYNLPCKFVIHVAGPQIFGDVTKDDENALSKCYSNALEKADELKLKNVVFCCISTGLYDFPNKLACKIAVATVKDWLKENKSDIKVIFNTFKDLDEVIYERELQ